jgi:hypothetical protein
LPAAQFGHDESCLDRLAQADLIREKHSGVARDEGKRGFELMRKDVGSRVEHRERQPVFGSAGDRSRQTGERLLDSDPFRAG